MKSTLRVLLRTFDTLLWLHFGRPDKYWSWFVVTAVYGAITAFVVFYGDVPLAEIITLPWAIFVYGLPLLLVPVRKKWGWPRG